MRKSIAKKRAIIALGGGGLLASLGVLTGLVVHRYLPFSSPPQSIAENASPTTAIAPLLPQSPQQRQPALLSMATRGNTLEQSQSRYLLAADALQQSDGKTALKWLQDLEANYPLLAAPILVQRARAYEVSAQTQQSRTTWQEVLQKFPNQPEAAYALAALGKNEPKYWDQAIASFPSHPQTIAIVQTRLKANPNQPQLLLLLARHALYLPEITQILDRLTTNYSRQLTPEDWAAIGFGYWEKLAYKKAGQAYARAPKTALNLYRAGRGLQLGGEIPAARQAYQQMITAFPSAKETLLSLLRLAALSESPQGALSYLERAIQLAPQIGSRDRAGEALLAKIRLLEKQGNRAAVAQARQQLFNTYGDTDAAAELRWQLAQAQAKAQNWEAARRQALEIAERNPDSPLAPTAVYWSGEWARQLNQQAGEQQAFQMLWRRYPYSYYTWRAASLSGWAVGDFTSVRSLQPQISPDRYQRLPLPTGSPPLRELYALGQNRDAWSRWQWEFRNRVQPTVAEQLTDGLMRLGVADYLDGIFMLENLRQRSRSEPETRAWFTQLQRQPGYWYALYPLPHLQPVTHWSEQRQLNPLLGMALIRQESRFQTQIRSVAGAVGLMQVMPETGAWIAAQLKLDRYGLEQVEDNVKLGTWYLDYTHDNYRNNTLLALASYNAGPGNLEDWLNRFGFTDPDVFIEAIPFSETQNYVKAVMENYWNYLRLYNPETAKHLQQQR